MPCDSLLIASPFNLMINDALNALISYPIARAYLIGFIGAEIAVEVSMQFSFVGFLMALGFSLLAKEILLKMSWESAEGLKGSFVGQLFSITYGLLTTMMERVDLGIGCVADFLELSKANFWKLLWKFVHIPINIIYLCRIIFRVVELSGWNC